MIKFCTLFSGSSGNCIFIGTECTRFLVDAGVSACRIQSALEEIGESVYRINGIFITHEHTDHTKGAGILARRFRIPVYATPLTWKGMEKDVGNIPGECKMILPEEDTLSFGDITVHRFRTPHDALDSHGYVFTSGGHRLAVATDIGEITDEIRENLMGCDACVIEANHDLDMLWNGPYPYPLKKRIASEHGHLSNINCAEFCTELAQEGTKCLFLGHLSKENNIPSLAYESVRNSLLRADMNVLSECEPMRAFEDCNSVWLGVAPRDGIGRMLVL